MSSPNPKGADGDQPPTPEAKLFRSDLTTNIRALRIPIGLIQCEQRVILRRERGTKVLYCTDERKASTTNPYDWSNYEAVIECFESQPKRFAGIGFAFHECGPFAGIDLNDCLEDTTGNVKACVQPLIERFSDTYIEISPSGLGLKIWCLGKLPAAVAIPLDDGCSLEMYDQARYFTITGNVSRDAPLHIQEHADEVLAVFPHLADRRAFNSEAPRYPIPMEGKIPYGTQHLTLVSSAGTPRRRGVCDQAIEDCLQAINRYQCKRPGDPRDISPIVGSTRAWRWM